LAWVCQELALEGKKALLLVWDNASWHVSQRVKSWIREHNRKAKREAGVRIVVCGLPIKSPGLHPIEPKGMHGKRAIVEPDRLLSSQEIETRVCEYYQCQRQPRLRQTDTTRKRKLVA
jgi:hypothetical protein